ncbi:MULTISPECIES: hypothetical protein [Streptomyces]|uniref:hypothetical protein n=1 Tax=Streptomyces TaxID=1883 RepID=UPI0010BF50C2|nr:MULTISPECIES: hypothetical protein [Streptomyces]
MTMVSISRKTPTTTKCGGPKNDRGLRFGVPAAVALALTVTAGCGGAEREYQVPGDLCGIPIAANKVQPFLPGGKNLFQRDWTQNASSSGISCTLGVDDEDQLRFIGSWADRIAVDSRVAIDQGTPLLGGEYYTIPKNATAYFPCSNPKVRLGAPRSKDGKPHTVTATFYIVEVESLHHPKDEAESEKAMKRFIVPFAKAVKKKLPCR